MHMEEVYSIWYFNIILISLRIEVAQISGFLYMLKSCRFEKHFYIKFTTFYTGQERQLLERIIFRIFFSQCHNSLVFAAH